jgi:hypothetical protein
MEEEYGWAADPRSAPALLAGLINTFIGQVRSTENQMSDNPTYQELSFSVIRTPSCQSFLHRTLRKQSVEFGDRKPRSRTLGQRINRKSEVLLQISGNATTHPREFQLT